MGIKEFFIKHAKFFNFCFVIPGLYVLFFGLLDFQNIFYYFGQAVVMVIFIAIISFFPYLFVSWIIKKVRCNKTTNAKLS